MKSSGLRVLKSPVHSPKANAFCERLIGIVRRECLDYLIPINEHHLRRVVNELATHYNKGRPHSSLGPGIPEPLRAKAPAGQHRHKLAVGYRVRSARGTQFRQWATSRLKELLVKGFTLDDERIKAGRTLGENYFDELLARIRDIRSSERMFYQKITDIYATSIDYDASAEATQLFFQTVQNKMHWAAHGHTAAEIVRLCG